MNKKQTVELLQQQLPGFYSVEQVIKIINDIEEQGSLGADQIKTLIEEIATEVENKLDQMPSEDFVDFDSAEFDLNRNEISVTGIDINASTITEEVNDVISNAIHAFFRPEED